MSAGQLKIHHLGIAVADMDAALAVYQNGLGFVLDSEMFDDPIQRVQVCFLKTKCNDGFLIELVKPLGATSPVNGYLSKGIGAYHICYEVDEIDKTLAELRSQKCLPLGAPVPAVAFGGRRIAWCVTPTKHLIELVETQMPATGSDANCG